MAITNNAQIQVGDIGTQLQIEVVDQDSVVVDIGPATTKEICLSKPSGTNVKFTASFPSGGDGSDGLMEYITESGDLDEEGVWKIQGRVVFTTGEWRTGVDSFRVYDNIC